MSFTDTAASNPNGVTAPLVAQVELKVRGEAAAEIYPGTLAHASRPQAESGLPHKSLGYGMPCAKCNLYYAANLDSCPCCKSTQRVSPTFSLDNRKPSASASETNVAALEVEREAFLKKFKSQERLKSEAASAEAELTISAVTCTVSEHSDEEPEQASVCKPCYERMQERADVLEAALHIDLKEAAQIVYDAVWADPSDPSKTYANAAGALLAELRKRSGVPSLISPFQPLGN